MSKWTKMISKWKKRYLSIAVLIAALAVVATGTAAYFTAEETSYNVITTGMLHMELVEETTDGAPWPEDGVTGVMPGVAVDKVVYVENVGSVPFFTRIAMDQIIMDAQGAEGTLSLEYVMLDLNTEDWTEKDGFYYYNHILEPGEKTEPLFTKVSFSPEMGNEYQDATLEIYVLAQAVQSKNNGTDPLSALGWSEAAKTVIEMVEEIQAQEE